MRLNKLVALTRRRILMNILTLLFGDFFIYFYLVGHHFIRKYILNKSRYKEKKHKFAVYRCFVVYPSSYICTDG